MANNCSARISSRVKGHHVYNHYYKVVEEHSCVLEPKFRSDIFLSHSLKCFIPYQNRRKFTKSDAKLQGNREKLLMELGFLEAE